MAKLKIEPLTAHLWPALADLFGPHGATSGCWCMWWRVGGAQVRVANSQKNKLAFRDIVKQGPPPGLLAFDGDLAVGWCQVTPRTALPRLERSRIVARLDDLDVWSISCFYIRRGYRRQGVMSALIEAAIQRAKTQGAPALEAYPWDSPGERGSAGVYTGISSAFAKAGFKEIARHSTDRPIMRYDLATRSGVR